MIPLGRVQITELFGGAVGWNFLGLLMPTVDTSVGGVARLGAGGFFGVCHLVVMLRHRQGHLFGSVRLSGIFLDSGNGDGALFLHSEGQGGNVLNSRAVDITEGHFPRLFYHRAEGSGSFQRFQRQLGSVVLHCDNTVGRGFIGG